MKSSFRVVIQFHNYGIQTASSLYMLLDDSIRRGILNHEALEDLNAYGEVCVDRSGNISEVVSIIGLEKLTSLDINDVSHFSASIIVNAKDLRNPSDLMPLVLLQNEFIGIVSIGIDLGDITIEEQTNFIFKFSSFLLFADKEAPEGGHHSIYFINERKENRNYDTQSGYSVSYSYVSNNRVTALRYKSSVSKRNKESAIVNASRYFQPLLHVDKTLFGHLFQNSDAETSDEISYIRQSIEKLSASVKGYTPPYQGFSSLFEKWFFLAFYHSLPSEELKRLNVQGLNATLHDYYIGIYELVQNIIFHTKEQKGLLYVMFCKKEDLADYDKEKIRNGIKSVADRYLKIGVYDFSSKGISDTFCEENHIDSIKLSEMIDPRFLPDSGSDDRDVDYLSFTYAAHLGIKMLVSSVLYHDGWFKVESCQNGEKYALSSTASSIGSQEKVNNVKGTHYEVVLPVKELKNKNTYPIQSLSVADFLKNLIVEPSEIEAVNISECINLTDMNDVTASTSQWNIIEKWAERIVSKMHTSNGICSLNMEGTNPLNPNQIFKLLASLQLKQRLADVLVLVNLSDSIINHLCRIVRQVAAVKINKQQPLWSRDHAVVLYGKSFGAFVFCGETMAELSYVNKSMQHIYPGHENELASLEDGKSMPSVLDNVARPYECFIRVNGSPLFLQLANRELDSHLGGDNGGYLIDGFRTKIGSKLYIERFYEADTMFQNGFYVERYAYFIAQDLLNRLSHEGKSNRSIVLLGCYSYSEPLTRRIQYYVNQSEPDMVKQVVTAEEIENENTMGFHWQDMQNWTLSSFGDNYDYVLIVPISSTMSSHDKTISLFKKSTGCNSINFPFQYTVLLIRDGEGEQSATAIEKEWNIIDIADGVATTSYKNTKQVIFFIEKSSCWHNLLDIQTIPRQFENEIFLNRTKNASLNTQDFFGFPIAAIPDKERLKKELLFVTDKKVSTDLYGTYYELTCRRLDEMVNDIQIGHIEHHNNHHRYYFNTERYVGRERTKELDAWLAYQRHRFVDNVDSVSTCVIITPDVNKESCFVDKVNRAVFDNNALVVHLDVYSSAQNISQKYSFLQKLRKDCRFFFVDHAILTGETYNRTCRLMSFANSGKPFGFDGIITVVNRLSRSLFMQIDTEVGNYGIESYVWFSILPSQNTYTDCSLCGLERHYDNLERCTVTHDVKELCRNNSRKFRLKRQQYYKTQPADSDIDIETASFPRRKSRMMIRNKLFYNISRLAGVYNRGEEDSVSVETQPVAGEVELYLQKEYESIKKDVDKKISFLKAVTYPPLSQYVYIRQFAFKTNLSELASVLSKDGPEYEDFCLLKALLKHLSYLSSNALVRKNVIEGAWRLCSGVLNVVEQNLLQMTSETGQHDNKKKQAQRHETPDMFDTQIGKQLEELVKQKKSLESFKTSLLFYIKSTTFNDESKSFYIGELLRTGREPDVTRPLEIHASSEDISLAGIERMDEFSDFLDALYYDNNTILRKTLSNFEKEISKDMTGLYPLFKSETDRLLTLDVFKENINIIVEKLLDVVKDNYYYTWFRMYVTEDSINKGQLIDCDKDGVPQIRKMTYLLYAKLLFDKIEHGNMNNRNTYIEDVNTLLQLSLSVMDATDAYIVVRYDKRYNMLAHCGGHEINELTESSYIELIEKQCKESAQSPFIIVEDEKIFSELSTTRYKKACFFPLYGGTEASGGLLGMVGFLYDSESQKFRVRKQACARLLMLLGEELERYINHCKAQKFLEIWYEQEETRRRYRKTNFTSNHRLNLGKWDFDTLDKENYVKIHDGLFMMSNVVVSHVYSVVCENGKVNFISKNTTIGNVFNPKFLALLEKLNKENWGGNLKPVTLGDAHYNLKCNVIIMQSLIIQCIENAYGKYTDKKKSIEISFGEKTMLIYNTIMKVDVSKLTDDKREFDKKYNEKTLEKNIRESRLSDYGMTLVSLYEYTKSVGMKCQWEFNVDSETPFFKIEITI